MHTYMYMYMNKIITMYMYRCTLFSCLLMAAALRRREVQ